MPTTSAYLVHKGLAEDGENWDITNDHGPLEAAYLAAVRDLADEAGVTRFEIRDPLVAAFVTFGLEPPIPGHGLDGPFPRDLTGFHDGADVDVDGAVQLVRAMLRDHGAWCRLEVEDRLFVHVGYDQCMYLGSDCPSDRAVRRLREAGLVVEAIERSPYDPAFDDTDAPFGRRPADETFWAEVTALVRARGALLLEATSVSNAPRWYRVTDEQGVARARAALAPRSRILVWPDLSQDLAVVAAELTDDFLGDLVIQLPDGSLRSRTVYDLTPDLASELLSDATAAKAVTARSDERAPLLAAVLPDPDGVIRARQPPT